MRPAWRLGALLVLSESVYLFLSRFDAVNGVRPVLIFMAAMGLLFLLYWLAWLVVRDPATSDGGTLGLIAAGAVLFRLTLLPAGLPPGGGVAEVAVGLRADIRGEEVAFDRFLLFDSDHWRYLWDGHVGAHGLNPYRYPAAAAELDRLADPETSAATDGRTVWADIRDNVGYAGVATIYPPLAQFVFRVSHAIAPGSVFVLKSLVVLLDLLAAALVALTLSALGRSMAPAILYAWNPLVIKVFAGSGHIDALAVAALAATALLMARGARRAAAVAFGLAVLAKLSPIILAPLVLRRVGWRNLLLAGGVIALGYAPFASVGPLVFEGFATFARNWRFNAGPYFVVETLVGLVLTEPGIAARAIASVAIAGIALWIAIRDDGRLDTFSAAAAPTLGALVFLGPTVMPWYLTWVLPAAVVARQRFWLIGTVLVCFAFLVMIDGQERTTVLWAEYGLLAVVGWLCLRSARAPAPPDRGGRGID